jgi:hypothetical protein
LFTAKFTSRALCDLFRQCDGSGIRGEDHPAVDFEFQSRF